MFRSDSVLRELHERLAVAMVRSEASEEAQSLWLRIAERRAEIVDEHSRLYPDHPPNDECTHAEVRGIKFENGTLPAQGDLRHLMTWGHEHLSLWTHTRDKYTGLIAEVDPDVKRLDVWKTFASALRAALGLYQALERLQDVDYLWIYRFEPQKGREDQEYRNAEDATGLGSAVILSLRAFSELVPLLDLLLRSDRFFVAAQNLLVASENHRFCQECALRPPEHRVHEDHEPAPWERALVRPKLEAAIVQATRAVEAILGKPGNRESPSKLARVKQRWTTAIDLTPDEEFPAAGASYLDYYYKLFEIRGSAAHSLGELPFELNREMTIEAQSFAWLVLNSYFDKHCSPLEVAQQNLRVNVDLIDSEPEDWSTPLTAESRNRLGYGVKPG